MPRLLSQDLRERVVAARGVSEAGWVLVVVAPPGLDLGPCRRQGFFAKRLAGCACQGSNQRSA